MQSSQVCAEYFSTGVHWQRTAWNNVFSASFSCPTPSSRTRNQSKGGSASCCNPVRFAPKDHPRTKPPLAEKVLFLRKVNVNLKGLRCERRLRCSVFRERCELPAHRNGHHQLRPPLSFGGFRFALSLAAPGIVDFGPIEGQGRNPTRAASPGVGSGTVSGLSGSGLRRPSGRAP